MVRNELVQEILKLRQEDREFIRDLVLASLSEDSPSELSPEEQQVLMNRLEQYRSNPKSFLSWEEVKDQLARRRASN